MWVQLALLREQGVQLSKCTDEQGSTLLHNPARQNFRGTALALLGDAPELVYQADNLGCTPFVAAVNEHHLELAGEFWRKVLEQGSHSAVTLFDLCQLRTDKYGKTLTHYAAANASQTQAQEAVEMLAKHALQACRSPADLLNARDTEGCTPLHYAAAHGKLETLKHLLAVARFADPSRKLELNMLLHTTSKGYNVMMCAASAKARGDEDLDPSSSIDIVKELSEHVRVPGCLCAQLCIVRTHCYL